MLLGVTGGIASGKTTVSNYLKILGCIVIDADEINRELSRPGEPIWHKIKKEFGADFFLPDGRIDKKKLGELIFNEPAKKKKLEEIAHPLIIAEENKRIEKIRKEFHDKVIVLEAALIIEAGQHHRVDKLIVVNADKKKRIEWLSREKGIYPDEAEKRIKTQMPFDEKAKFADYIIQNNGTKDELALKVKELFLRIT